MRLAVVFGPPGTGKTRTLLDYLGSNLDSGVPSTRIAFVTFTRAARKEARSRAQTEYGIEDRDLPWFRTLHSACWGLLGLRKDNLMRPSSWRRFCELHRYQLTEERQWEDDDQDLYHPPRRTDDDLLRYAYEWGRHRLLTPKDTVRQIAVQVSLGQLQLFADRYHQFKAEHQLLDYQDILERGRTETPGPDVDVAFVDEAQDLTPLQQQLVETWFWGVDKVYVAGDDDQAIYAWSGADPGWLIGLRGKAAHVEVLDRSYRVPAAIHGLANAIIRENRQRVPKEYRPERVGGRITYGSSSAAIKRVNEVLAADKRAEVFLLFRNRQFMTSYYQQLLDARVPFALEGRGANSPLTKVKLVKAIKAADKLRSNVELTAAEFRQLIDCFPSKAANWELPHGTKARAKENQSPFTRAHAVSWGLQPLLQRLDTLGAALGLMKARQSELEYLQAILDEHGQLPRARVRMMTIHGSKGREADLVVVCPQMSGASWNDYRRDPEAENRVAYVAVTRSKDELFVVHPESRRCFPYDRYR